MSSYDFYSDPENLFTRFNCIMELKICVDDNLGNLDKYKQHIHDHNSKLFFDPFPDSGFDLLTPSEYVCNKAGVNKINFGVKCCAQLVYNNDARYTTGYYMYPRSSLSKSPLRLANSVGIIDSGYRGNLIGMFDMLSVYDSNNYVVNKFDRLLQICAPNLVPIYVQLVDGDNDLNNNNSSRGSGGFGSSGV